MNNKEIKKYIIESDFESLLYIKCANKDEIFYLTFEKVKEGYVYTYISETNVSIPFLYVDEITINELLVLTTFMKHEEYTFNNISKEEYVKGISLLKGNEKIIEYLEDNIREGSKTIEQTLEGNLYKILKIDKFFCNVKKEENERIYPFYQPVYRFLNTNDKTSFIYLETELHDVSPNPNTFLELL